MALSPLQQAGLQAPRTPAYEVQNWLQYGNGTGATGPDGGNKVGLYTNQGKYTLYDNRTGKVLAEGSSPEELKNISDIITGTLVPQGNDADWRLYSSNPVVQTRPHREFLGGGEGPLKLEGNPFGDVIQGYTDLSTPGDPRGTVIAGDMPNNLFKDMILPLLAVPAATAGAYFGGNALLGGLGGGGAGAGLSGITGASAGNAALASLANVPIAAGLPATTAGLGAGVSAIGGAAGTAGAAGGAAGGAALGGGAGFAGPGITVIGKPGLTALQAAGAFSPGVGGGLSNLLTNSPVANTAATGAGSGAGTSVTASPADQIVATGVKGLSLTPTEIAAIIAGGSIPATAGVGSGVGSGASTGATSTGGQPGTAGPNGEIVVTGGKPINVVDAFINGTLTSAQIGDIANQLANQSGPNTPSDQTGPDKTGPGKTTIGNIVDYLQLAGMGIGTLGSLFGGGGGGGEPVKYTGTGVGNPIFDAELPEPSLPGGARTMTARQMPEQNWHEYGFHPSQSFFNTSAPGYTPQPGKTRGMARGGEFAVSGPGDGRSEFAVSGPGDGRSDSIPARLSDGEYVIDAETVALLGNGSPKAGAERLDAFRVNVRKHKGRDLAQGKFSVKAKRPEAYMAGGRA